MATGSFILFGISLLGVFVACRVFAYEISAMRMAGSALCFTLLNIIPIPVPIISFLLPLVGLYVCLMDNTYDRATVNKVFGLTFAIAVVGLLVVYQVRTAG